MVKRTCNFREKGRIGRRGFSFHNQHWNHGTNGSLGAEKMDWNKYPSVASHGNFKAEAYSASSVWSVNSWYRVEALQSSKPQWVRKNYKIYNYLLFG
ncbi:hypothetical protein SUGI_0178880 [Cryptomeria japonica]|nr:hypothetical protein SUGI_0178880 [Cryptomeria japonica]